MGREWDEAFFQCAVATAVVLEIILLLASILEWAQSGDGGIEPKSNKVIPLLAAFVFSFSGLCSLFSSRENCLLDDMCFGRRGLNRCWLAALVCLGVDLVLSFFLIVFVCLAGYDVAGMPYGVFAFAMVLLVVPRLCYEAAVAFRFLLRRREPDGGSEDYIGPMLWKMKAMRKAARKEKRMERGEEK